MKAIDMSVKMTYTIITETNKIQPKGQEVIIMARQELIKMTGNEEQATLAIDILLSQVQPDFIEMAIRAELKDVEAQITNAEKEGLIVKTNGIYAVNWRKEYEPLNGETVWNATEEQTKEMNTIRDKLYKADALLYRRNRIISLTAVK